MRPPEEFATNRLSLRPPVLEDAAAIFETYAQDLDVVKYLSWRPHQNIDETRGYLGQSISAWEQGTDFLWMITRRDQGRLIGAVVIRIDGHRASLGYVLSKAEWGNGYMAEAVQKIVEWALNQEEIFRVWAVCDIENTASARVMEKVGMKREGILGRWIKHPNLNLSDEPRDCCCYARVK